MHATTIVAYTYNAETLCPACTARALGCPKGYLRKGGDPIEWLWDEGDLRGIDVGDESSFDSGDFPKVVFADQVEDDSEFCDQCNGALI